MNVSNPGQQPTREIWIPSHYWSGAAVSQQLGDHPMYPLTDGGPAEGAVEFVVPQDYTAVLEAVIVIVPLVTDAALARSLFTDYGSPGQAYNVHTEQEVGQTSNVTANQIFEVDCIGVLSAIVAGDQVGLAYIVAAAGDNVDILGFRMRYL